jgi:hypothetical protein
LTVPLDFLNRTTRRKAVIFLFSDFHAANFERPLAVCSRRHDLIAIPIDDPGDFDLPPVGLVQVEEPETGVQYQVNFSDPRVREEFRRRAQLEKASLDSLFRRKNIDSLSLQTNADYFPSLRSFFLRREQRLKRRT